MLSTGANQQMLRQFDLGTGVVLVGGTAVQANSLFKQNRAGKSMHVRMGG